MASSLTFSDLARYQLSEFSADWKSRKASRNGLDWRRRRSRVNLDSSSVTAL